ncbi:putative quinol monooxygenase [Frondihabitans cladoniiphilus]
MSQTVLLELSLKPDAIDSAKEVIRETLKATAAAEGNESLEVIVDDADPTKVVIVEKWRAAADHDAYLAWRATPEGASSLGSIVTGAPVTRTFEPFVAL